MPCHRTEYDGHDIRTPATHKHIEKREKPKKKTKRKKKKKSKHLFLAISGRTAGISACWSPHSDSSCIRPHPIEGSKRYFTRKKKNLHPCAHTISHAPTIVTINNRRVFWGEIVWVGFLVVCSPHETNPNERKNILLSQEQREELSQMPLFNLHLSWAGLALGWGVRRSHKNIYLVRIRYSVICFPTEPNSVNVKHPLNTIPTLYQVLFNTNLDGNVRHVVV